MRESSRKEDAFLIEAKKRWPLLLASVVVSASAVAIVLLGLTTSKTIFKTILFKHPYDWVFFVFVIILQVLTFYAFATVRRNIYRIVSLYATLFSKLRGRAISGSTSSATTTAVAALSVRRAYERQLASSFIALSLIVYVGTAFLPPRTEPSLLVMALMVGGLVLLRLSDWAMRYRIKSALYGTNEYEVRQIISFALEYAEDIDLSGGTGKIELSAINPETEAAAEALYGLGRASWRLGN